MTASARSIARRASQVLLEFLAAWRATYTGSMGAALAFYTLFSLPPLLILGNALSKPFLPARALVVDQLTGLLGGAGAQAIDSAQALLLGALWLRVHIARCAARAAPSAGRAQRRPRGRRAARRDPTSRGA